MAGPSSTTWRRGRPADAFGGGRPGSGGSGCAAHVPGRSSQPVIAAVPAAAPARLRRHGGRGGDSLGVPSSISGGAIRARETRGAKWELVEGDDIDTEHVLAQHRLWQQVSLLGQGAAEGFLDHEFQPGSKSINGLEVPQVVSGQERVIELTASVRRAGAADDDEEPPPDAPRCQCGRRARLNRVRLPGAVFCRPYFRCAGRICRFLAFGDTESTTQQHVLPWLRFETGTSVSSRYVVVGAEGYRPEDVRFGGESVDNNSSMSVRFADALAVLAERPALVAQLLPNASPSYEGASASCHEVRLFIDGRWRAYLVDEWLPVMDGWGGGDGLSTTSAASAAPGRNEKLVFARTAGNQLWASIIEKAYAKAYGAYHFALPGIPIDEVLADLTGAFVETIRLGIPGDQAALHGIDGGAEGLWRLLGRLVDAKTIMACSSRPVSGRASVHSLLGIAEAEDPLLVAVGIRSCRAVRLRSPRTGLNASASCRDMVSVLGGVPAQGSTYADDSFWVRFPHGLIAAFARLDVCHAKLAGGAVAHARSFEGEFTPEKGLGTRGCALCVVAASGVGPVECWFAVCQTLPTGARLLRPAIGRVLNDLGIVVLALDAEGNTGDVVAVACGGAWRDVTVRFSMEPDTKYVVLPFSFRAWPGSFTCRVQSTALVWAAPADTETYAPAAWGALLRLLGGLLIPSQAVQPGLRQPSRRSWLLPMADFGNVENPCKAEMIAVELEGVAWVMARNPHPTLAVLVEVRCGANYMAVHTSRGTQFGEWDEARNEIAQDDAMRGSDDASRPDWRRYLVEDVVPPASIQLVCMLVAIAREGWVADIADCSATFVPADICGLRPASHPFAPRALGSEESPDAGAELKQDGFYSSDVDESMCRALELSLVEAKPQHPISSLKAEPLGRAPAVSGGVANVKSGRRWGRRARLATITCIVCTESICEAAPIPCCSDRVCTKCVTNWASMQVQNGEDLRGIRCPSCTQLLAEDVIPALLSEKLLAIASSRSRERQGPAATKTGPLSEKDLGLSAGQLAMLGTKRCPACGSGVQRETETCHKMICRMCRAKFCFRCLTRLEYFNCGCTGAEHRFVDPIDGRILAHQ